MSGPEKGNTLWKEMGISKKQFIWLVVKDISGRIAHLVKKGVSTEVHPKGKNTGIAIVKGVTAYGVGQIIGHEFYVIPNIEDIVQMYHGTIETSEQVYANREEIKNSIIEVLREKEFLDYVRAIGNILSDTLGSAWNLPLKEKFGIYLEFGVAGGISGYMKNLVMKNKAGRNMTGIFKKFGDNPELRERFFRMKEYRSRKKED